MTIPATPAVDTRPGPLAGVRVLDLIDGLGAYGPKLLAGLGAEVIRVEPLAGARHRCRPPFYTAVDTEQGAPSLHYFHYNAGKLGITLDTGAEQGRALLRRLLDAVDVVLDNGELSRWGMDPPALTEASPLVVVSVTPFGVSSARSHWQGGDLVCQAMSGMIGLFGFRDEWPARFGPEQASEMGGLAAALGALITLFGARRRGVGEFIDIALERVGALVTFQMSNASIYHQFGYVKQRTPRADGVRGALYETKDGFVTLGAYRRLDELMAMLEEAGAAEDLPELHTTLPEPEFIASPHVEEVVRRFAAGLTRAELVERAQAHGMLGLPVHDVADLLADPFLQDRAFFVEVPHPELEAVLTYTGAPMRFSATPYRIDRRPPLLGEHNESVYGRLGLDAGELARLRAEGLV
jgi:benzylsuccinate CoA-transferase BbsE subunit